MRRAARTDRNHTEICEALRAVGCSVQSLAACGNGVPDLLVSAKGRLILLEVKDGLKPISKRKLTPAQVQWRVNWGSHTHVVTSVDAALEAAGFRVR